MKKAAIFCFLLVFYANPANAEEYRVSDGTVSVMRTENYIRFDYAPDDCSDCSHVVYSYYLREEDRGFRELRIHRATRPTIFISVSAVGEVVYVSSGAGRCYCAMHRHRCVVTCRIAKVLFGIWVRKLQVDKHVVDPSDIIIF